MKRKLEVDIPKCDHAEVDRKRSLKSSLFTRTRIAALSLCLILALSVTGTLAFLSYTANQTPNRVSTGEVELHIVEDVGNASGGATAVVDQDQSGVYYARGNKKVRVFAGTAANRVDEKVRVSFVPEIESKTYSGANMLLSENWTNTALGENATDGKYLLLTTTTSTGSGKIKLLLANDWDTYWDYSDGTFTYKDTLGKGEATTYLLEGVNLDGDSSVLYGNVKINVIASAIQEGATDAW